MTHTCPIPDDVLPKGDEDWWRDWCVCVKRGHRGMIYGPTEIAPRKQRIPGPSSPLAPCTCECHQ